MEMESGKGFHTGGMSLAQARGTTQDRAG